MWPEACCPRGHCPWHWAASWRHLHSEGQALQGAAVASGCLAGSRTGGAWGARLCGFAVGGWRRGPGSRGVGQKHRPGPRTPLCLLLTGQPPTRQLEPSVPSAGQAPWPGAGHPLSAPHPHYSSRRLRVASCGSLDPIDPTILGTLRGGQPWQVGRRRALGCWARWSAQGPGQPAAHHTTLFR